MRRLGWSTFLPENASRGFESRRRCKTFDPASSPCRVLPELWQGSPQTPDRPRSRRSRKCTTRRSLRRAPPPWSSCPRFSRGSSPPQSFWRRLWRRPAACRSAAARTSWAGSGGGWSTGWGRSGVTKYYKTYFCLKLQLTKTQVAIVEIFEALN